MPNSERTGYARYIPLKISWIDFESPLSFDIYRLDDNIYHLLARKGTIVSAETRKDLKEIELKVLHIDRNQSQGLTEFFAKRINLIISDDVLPQEKKASILNTVSSYLLERSISSALEDPDFEEVSKQSEIHINFSRMGERSAKALVKDNIVSTFTISHSLRVANLCLLTGINLEINEFDELRKLVVAAMLHEIGKMRINPAHYRANDSLGFVSDNRFRKYPSAGAKMLMLSRGVPPGSWVGVRDHQERIDGSGFPEGLRGQEISRAGQLIGACDYYDSQVAPIDFKSKKRPFDVL